MIFFFGWVDDWLIRYRELRRLKVPERSPSAAIFSPKGAWRPSFSEALHRAFTKARFRQWQINAHAITLQQLLQAGLGGDYDEIVAMRLRPPLKRQAGSSGQTPGSYGRARRAGDLYIKPSAR